MKSCRYLQEYAAFVGKVKEYKKKYTDLDMAIDHAIDYCIEHDIMRDICNHSGRNTHSLRVHV